MLVSPLRPDSVSPFPGLHPQSREDEAKGSTKNLASMRNHTMQQDELAVKSHWVPPLKKQKTRNPF
jgi:hypothetical protein